eukprot:361775-Chlamydomonas_euryale.AAC.14
MHDERWSQRRQGKGGEGGRGAAHAQHAQHGRRAAGISAAGGLSGLLACLRAQRTPRPRYSVVIPGANCLPSCAAFFSDTIGCMTMTSQQPANAPMAVCSSGLTSDMGAAAAACTAAASDAAARVAAAMSALPRAKKNSTPHA